MHWALQRIALLLIGIGVSGCCHCPQNHATTATATPTAEREHENAVSPLGTGNIPVATNTTGNFHGCPPKGDGGDPWLNQLKNRDIPPSSYQTKSVRELLDDEPEDAAAEGKKKRAAWDREARDEIKDMEASGAVVEGYLLRVKKEGPESCNCHSADYVDHHMWLAANADDTRGESVVVEVSPRMFATPHHPNWTEDSLQKLSHDQIKVKVSGWLMWDQEHPEQLGNTRGTLWEIHPIHRIEFYKDGHWTDLDDSKP